MSKKNRRKMRKALATMLAALLLVVVSVGATVAYLTDKTEVVTNTFTTGNVSFDQKGALDEADVNEYGEQEYDVVDNPETPEDESKKKDRVMKNTYKLIPGHSYLKDPTVHMADVTEDAWLFVKVENGIEAIEADKTIKAQMKDLGWVEVTGETGVYAYNRVVKAKEDIKVFETFTLKTDANVSAYETAKITVQAYIVQADSFKTAADAWKDAPLDAWKNQA